MPTITCLRCGDVTFHFSGLGRTASCANCGAPLRLRAGQLQRMTSRTARPRRDEIDRALSAARSLAANL